MTPVRLSGGFQYAMHERLAAVAMEFQFLVAVDEGAEVAEQRVLIFTRETHVTRRLVYGHLKREHPQAHKNDNADEDGPREPAEVNQTGDQDRRLHDDRRNAGERTAYSRHVVVERREQTMWS